MKRRAALVATMTAAVVGGSGVVASAWLDTPQDATPAQAPADPIADLLRRTPANPPAAQPTPPPTQATPTQASPTQAPGASPGPVGSAPAAAPTAPSSAETTEEAATVAEVTDAPPPAGAVTEPDKPLPRQRRRTVIVQAIDKITAETMRFEVEVGGRPVRFKQTLIFTARACEVSPPEDRSPETAAYLEISLQPRGEAAGDARQLFQGWMFASSPAVSGMQHAVYDAWVVGCK